MGNKIILSLIILIAVGGIILMKSPDKSASEVLDQGVPTEVISRNGLHWHSTLLIYVKGEKMEIPANIGLGAVHNPIHTHVEDAPAGIIHLEFSGLVRNSNTRLDEFFKAWNKTIRTFSENVTMTVNGEPSTAYENYYMKDGDVIELRYE